jgi:hypothetical protein
MLTSRKREPEVTGAKVEVLLDKDHGVSTATINFTLDNGDIRHCAIGSASPASIMSGEWFRTNIAEKMGWEVEAPEPKAVELNKEVLHKALEEGYKDPRTQGQLGNKIGFALAKVSNIPGIKTFTPQSLFNASMKLKEMVEADERNIEQRGVEKGLAQNQQLLAVSYQQIGQAGSKVASLETENARLRVELAAAEARIDSLMQEGNSVVSRNAELMRENQVMRAQMAHVQSIMGQFQAVQLAGAQVQAGGHQAYLGAPAAAAVPQIQYISGPDGESRIVPYSPP